MYTNNYPVNMQNLDADLLMAAIEYTTANTELKPELIEKDFYCSLVLKYIFSHNTQPLIFKGGTLLTKVYADFYRLSEDLDFSISIRSIAHLLSILLMTTCMID